MELLDDGESRESSEGRQTKGIERVESMGVRQKGLRRCRMESKAIWHERTRREMESKVVKQGERKDEGRRRKASGKGVETK